MVDYFATHNYKSYNIKLNSDINIICHILVKLKDNNLLQYKTNLSKISKTDIIYKLILFFNINVNIGHFKINSQKHV